MKIRQYLYERVRLGIFFLVLLAFVLLIVTLDRANRLLPSNTTYLLVISVVLFIIYLITDYLISRSHYTKLVRLIDAQGTAWANNLPTAKTMEQKAYRDLLAKLYREHTREISRFQAQSKEDEEFITAWVHEIKTPIAVANLLIQNSNSSASETTLESIEEELAKIEDYVAKALFYSRSNDFAKDYLIKEVDLETLVKDSVKRHAKVFIRKKIKVQVNKVTEHVSSDQKWLGFILDQILSNALKYTPDQGTIAISTEDSPNELIMEVADTGVGIRMEDLNRVFERGFTGQNGRRELGSTGMGLYLSQRVARKLGHKLTVASELSAGTKVRIHFPKWSNYFDITKM